MTARKKEIRTFAERRQAICWKRILAPPSVTRKAQQGAESGEEMLAAERQPLVISIRPLLSPSAYGASAGIWEIARCRGWSR